MAAPPAAHPDVTSPVRGLGTHLRPSPRLIEIPKDLGWEQEVGPGAIKWLPLPPPGPGTALGSGKTQKTGSSSATNSAAASVGAAEANAAAGSRARVPAPAGARPEAGSIPGRRRSLLVRFARSTTPPTPHPQRELFAPQIKTLRRGGEMERKGKTYLVAEGSARLALRTRQVSAPRAQAEGAGAAPSAAPLERGRKPPLPPGPARRSSRSRHRATQARAPLPPLCWRVSLPASRGSAAPPQTTPCHLGSPPLLPL